MAEHPDLRGHVADAARDSCLRHLGRVVTFDQSQLIADDLVARMRELAPAPPQNPTPEMVEAGLTTGSRFGKRAMAAIWRTMYAAAPKP